MRTSLLTSTRRCAARICARPKGNRRSRLFQLGIPIPGSPSSSWYTFGNMSRRSTFRTRVYSMSIAAGRVAAYDQLHEQAPRQRAE